MHADRTNRVALTVFGLLVLLAGVAGMGTTILQPNALSSALTREIGTYHGVDSAQGRIIGDPGEPEIVITVTASQSAGLHAVHQRIETEALTHARRALGQPDLPIQLDLGVSRRTA